MSWKDKLMIPGFMGQAMRTKEAELKNIGSDESKIDRSIENNQELMDTTTKNQEEFNHTDLGHTPDSVTELGHMHDPIITGELKNVKIEKPFMELPVNRSTKPKVTARVIGGTNQNDLETKLNEFLDTLNDNQQIEDTKFTANAIALYYTVLYSTKVEMV
jgi:hypothetical protein